MDSETKSTKNWFSVVMLVTCHLSHASFSSYKPTDKRGTPPRHKGLVILKDIKMFKYKVILMICMSPNVMTSLCSHCSFRLEVNPIMAVPQSYNISMIICHVCTCSQIVRTCRGWVWKSRMGEPAGPTGRSLGCESMLDPGM